MKAVFVRHQRGGNVYIFRTDMTINRGFPVIVETKYGLKYGWTVTDSFEIGKSFYTEILPKLGSTKLMPVVGFTTWKILNKVLEKENSLDDKKVDGGALSQKTLSQRTIEDELEDYIADIRKSIDEY